MEKQPDIYSHVPARQGIRHQRAASTWVENAPVTVKVRAQEPRVAAVAQISSAVDELMLEILRSPAAPTETVEIAFRRKEAEMLALCAQLSPIESMQLAKRLERGKPGDELAAAFGRLIVDRRQRVLRFLGDARRRAALAGRK